MALTLWLLSWGTQNFGNASINNNPVSNNNSLPVPGLSFRVGGQGFSPDSLPPATFVENKMKMEEAVHCR